MARHVALPCGALFKSKQAGTLQRRVLKFLNHHPVSNREWSTAINKLGVLPCASHSIYYVACCCQRYAAGDDCARATGSFETQ